MKLKIHNQDKDSAAILWDLQRFGLSPKKLTARLASALGMRSGPKPVLVCSLPKSGTHLLETILCMHPAIFRPLVPTLEPRNIARFGSLDAVLRRARPGHLYVSHFPFSDTVLKAAQRAGVAVLFLKRDPRAVLSSDVRYIDKRTDHYMHPYQAALDDIRDKVRLQLRGVPEENVVPFAERLDAYRTWENREGVLSLRFEDIAPRCGNAHPVALRRIFDFLEAPASDSWLRALPYRLPAKATPTFRSGESESWRRELPEDLVAEIEHELGPTMTRFGYT